MHNRDVGVLRPGPDGSRALSDSKPVMTESEFLRELAARAFEDGRDASHWLKLWDEATKREMAKPRQDEEAA